MKRKPRTRVEGEWLKHLRKIAESRSAKKTEACRDNLAKAREAKQLKRLGMSPMNGDQ
jgi:hypothetical protein